MQRPNLARRPFLDTRPVRLLAGALTLLAVVLTGISLREVLSVRGDERALATRMAALQERRARLRAEVDVANRRLNAVGWKKLRAETASLEGVVAERNLAWSVLLADLERLLPWNVRLLSITPVAGEGGQIGVALEGLATDREAWLTLLGRCFTDPHFADPIPGSEVAPGPNNAQGFKFTLRVRYLPEGRR